MTRRIPGANDQAYLDDFGAEVRQVIYGVLLPKRQSCMLEQSFPVFIWHSVSMQNPKSDDPNFVLVTVRKTGETVSDLRRLDVRQGLVRQEWNHVFHQ